MTQEKYKHRENFKYQLLIKKLLNMPLLCSTGKEIVYRDKVRLTYRDLYERINRLANGLHDLGVGQGDTVAVFEYDSHRYLECFFAIPMMGAILQPMNYKLLPDQIVFTLNHVKAKIIMVNSELLPIIEGIKSKLKTVQKIILISEDEKTHERTCSVDAEYEDMLKNAASVYDFPDFDENTKATTFYTKGTTGLPKRVHFTHRQLVVYTFAVMTMLGAFDNFGRFTSGNDVYMPLTPMFHVHAWGLPYLATLLGTKQVYPGKYESQMILKLIIKEGVTFSHCDPMIIKMLVANPVIGSVDLSKWKVMIGDAGLPKELAESAMKLKIDICTGHGMSETYPLMSVGLLKEHMMNCEEDRQTDRTIDRLAE